LSQPAQLAFFHEIGLSRLNPIFFKIGVEPAQIDFFSDGQIVPKNPLLSFLATFGLSRLNSDF
jgi:hypothetical protein